MGHLSGAPTAAFLPSLGRALCSSQHLPAAFHHLTCQNHEQARASPAVRAIGTVRRGGFRTEMTARHTPRRSALRNLSLQAVQLAAMLLANAPPAGAAPDPLDDGIKVYGYRVTERFPHDEASFTQGLEFDPDGHVIEGTGLYGESKLRRVDISTGKVKQSRELLPELFGEGVTVLGDTLIQLTWKENLGLLYDKTSFERTGSFKYPYEGWGATAVNGKLLTTDGTNIIREWSPATWKEERAFTLTDAKGRAVDEIMWNVRGRLVKIKVRLNELEEVGGEIWANLWPTETLVRFDAKNGKILGWIDLRGLMKEAEAAGTSGQIDVLNGIAHRPASEGRGEMLLVTGKWWARAFALQILDPETCAEGGECAPETGRPRAAGWATTGEVLALSDAELRNYPLADFGN